MGFVLIMLLAMVAALLLLVSRGETDSQASITVQLEPVGVSTAYAFTKSVEVLDDGDPRLL